MRLDPILPGHRELFDGCPPPGTPAWVLVLIGAGSVLFLGAWVYGVWVWRKKRRKA